MGVYWYTRKSHEPFETDEKLILAKQATSKPSFLPGSKFSIVVTANVPKNDRVYDMNGLKLISLPLSVSISTFKVFTA